MHADRISMHLPILHFKGSQVEILNYDVFMSLMTISANNADPGEMPSYAAFHLGLHC